MSSEFAPTLEREAPWLFCGDGMSEDLAPELLGDLFAPYGLDAAAAKQFARMLNAHAEFGEDSTEVPDRLAAGAEIEKLLVEAQKNQRGEPLMWLQSAATFRPTISVQGGAMPSDELVARLVAAARECQYFSALVFESYPHPFKKLAAIDLRPV